MQTPLSQAGDRVHGETCPEQTSSSIQLDGREAFDATEREAGIDCRDVL
jgi:hypothetical protein